MVTVGIIGSGFGISCLLPAFNSTKNCQVTCVCIRNQKLQIKYKKSQKPRKIYASWQQMLEDEKLDAIAIAVPPQIQYKIAKIAIKKGVHVFAEKPLAATVKQTQELLRLAEKNNVKHMVDFMFSEIDEWIKVKQILEKELFGKLRFIYLNWDFHSYHNREKIKSWKSDISMGGGALSLYFCHSLYYLEHFAGKITNIQNRLLFSSYDTYPSEEGVDMLLTFSNGVTGYAHFNSDTPGLKRHQLIFICEKATIILENKGESWVNFVIKICSNDRDKFLLKENKKVIMKNDDRVKVVKKMTSIFIDSIVNDKKIISSFAEGVRVQKLIEKVRKSQL